MLTTGGTISSIETENGLIPSSANTILKQMGVENNKEFEKIIRVGKILIIFFLYYLYYDI